jgi:hypothetical protein
MPSVLVALGCVLLAVALFFLREGSGWGLFIAWLAGTWGAMLVAWGLIAGWYRSVAACMVGSAFALASVLVALLCVQRGAWDIAMMCAAASGLALVFGVYQLRSLLRGRG